MEDSTGPARRQPPPTPVPDALEHLAQELRVLKESTGLSLVTLAQRTHVSKSSWHRYLNGDQLPPRSAVGALAHLARADTASVLAKWDAAQRDADQRPIPATDEPSTPMPDTPQPNLARGKWLSAIGVAGLLAVVTTAGFLCLFRASGSVTAPVLPAACHGKACEGRSPDKTCERDARTESTAADAGFAVQLLFSPSCAAVWSVVRAPASESREVSIRDNQRELTASHTDGGPANRTSPMLAASDPHGMTACAKVGGKLACTGLDGTHDDLDDPPRR
ncbi:helix-turn-helix domain-containing protein [Streptomyces sp. NPDC004232]|uniref:helix-turn-helix domain-containing protein n=1 Tax=Streptomyces sp. NPDC004232 TaxID=3154454 RepID=UPI0033B6B5ED